MTFSLNTRVLDHLYTLILFTKSDVKTILIPVSSFAYAVSRVPNMSHAAEALFWIWLHLLQFTISNQLINPEEDGQNKPDRPLPSRRITIRQAFVIRWLLPPICFLWSYSYSNEVFRASLLLVALTIVHNELGGHRYFAIRNLLNAGGIASFEWGATLVASLHRDSLGDIARIAIGLSAGIFCTTIQAQDFKDVIGDALIGRSTLPIVSPKHARKTVLVGLLLWTCICNIVWELDLVAGSAFFTLAAVVGLRFLLLTSVQDDQFSYCLYNVWLSIAHALPGYWEYSVCDREAVRWSAFDPPNF